MKSLIISTFIIVAINTSFACDCDKGPNMSKETASKQSKMSPCASKAKKECLREDKTLVNDEIRLQTCIDEKLAKSK